MESPSSWSREGIFSIIPRRAIRHGFLDVKMIQVSIPLFSRFQLFHSRLCINPSWLPTFEHQRRKTQHQQKVEAWFLIISRSCKRWRCASIVDGGAILSFSLFAVETLESGENGSCCDSYSSCWSHYCRQVSQYHRVARKNTSPKSMNIEEFYFSESKRQQVSCANLDNVQDLRYAIRLRIICSE